ncbi:hypothetical protein [Jannaschia sp. LMIT008]|uniref:hypothetical protein n=1 Tax=Jannaschia maritima TaxID=3032585 RepID=UPI0028120D16|nr:hypothetical protein [Jannaschia sp. LMIT008]
MSEGGTLDAMLPPGYSFDDAADLPVTVVDGRRLHTMWVAAQHLADCLEHDGPRARDRATRIAARMPAFRDPDPTSPTLGNLRWEFEDAAVEDLNAAVFFAIRIAPALHRHADRLGEGPTAALRDTLRGAMDAVARIDVGPDYTNIAVQSAASLIVGGGVLDDPGLQALGADRLAVWHHGMADAGCAHEFNAPVYADMTIRALGIVERLGDDTRAARLARHARLRLVLSAALAIHPETGRMAPPHARAYAPALLGRTPPERLMLEEWVGEGLAPDWAASLMRGTAGSVRETADRVRGSIASSHHGPGYAMGTASRDLDTQANRFIAGQTTTFGLHYVGRGGGPGTIFAKYVVDDLWLGRWATAPTRPADQVFLDAGAFIGMQHGSRALLAYRPHAIGATVPVGRAALCLVVAQADHVAGLLVDGAPPDPDGTIPFGATVALDLGLVRVAVRSLGGKDLQPDAADRIVRRDGMLSMEFVDYDGPPRTFWRHATPGSFFVGHPRCALAVWAAPATQHDGLAAFAAAAAAMPASTVCDPPRRSDRGPRRWTLSLGQGDAAIGMEIDLHAWSRRSAWSGDGAETAPMLAADDARGARDGHVALDDARLDAPPGPVWLARIPGGGWVAAAAPGFARGDVRLTLPDGSALRVRDTDGAIVHHDGATARLLDASPNAAMTHEIGASGDGAMDMTREDAACSDAS